MSIRNQPKRQQKLEQEPSQPVKGQAGRPTIYNEAAVELLCRLYARAIGLTRAAEAAGISISTVKAWRKESRENPNGPKGDFWPRMRRAKAMAIGLAADEYRKVNVGKWLAVADPKVWTEPGRRVVLEGGGAKVPAMQAELSNLSDRELAEELRARADVLDQIANEQSDSSADPS